MSYYTIGARTYLLLVECVPCLWVVNSETFKLLWVRHYVWLWICTIWKVYCICLLFNRSLLLKNMENLKNWTKQQLNSFSLYNRINPTASSYGRLSGSRKLYASPHCHSNQKYPCCHHHDIIEGRAELTFCQCMVFMRQKTPHIRTHWAASCWSQGTAVFGRHSILIE